MTDPIVLRKTLENDLLRAASRLGPSKEITEYVHVPGKMKPVPMVFKLIARNGHMLSYSGRCQRCRAEDIAVQTTMGPHGREVWPPSSGFPQLCEPCEDKPVPLIKRDDIWEKAEAERDRQLKEMRRASQ